MVARCSAKCSEVFPSTQSITSGGWAWLLLSGFIRSCNSIVFSFLTVSLWVFLSSLRTSAMERPRSRSKRMAFSSSSLSPF